MENDLLVGQPRDLFDQIQQETFQIFVIGQEESEELVWLLEGDDRQGLEIFGIEVELFKDIAFIGGQDVVAFLASDYLTDGVASDQ